MDVAAPRQPAQHITLDLDRLHGQGMVTQDGARTSVAEDFRIIKRALLRKARGEASVPPLRHGNLIVVTSALPGEGKTYCAVNLAMSIAMERDNTVMLVDANVARPAVLEVLGEPPQPGLMEILLQEKADLADVLLKTSIRTLSIVPAGRATLHATELLASNGMSRLLTDLAERYADRVVIFDSPPLLATTEASVLAAQMGQVVLVVEAERTTQHAVKEAIARLQGCPNISLVYNKQRVYAGTAHHGYYD